MKRQVKPNQEPIVTQGGDDMAASFEKAIERLKADDSDQNSRDHDDPSKPKDTEGKCEEHEDEYFAASRQDRYCQREHYKRTRLNDF